MKLELGNLNGWQPGPKAKIATIATIALLVVVMILDWTLLRGTQVARTSVAMGPNDSVTIQLDRVGEEHLFEIDTKRRRRNARKGRAVKMRLVGPDGKTVYEGGEWVSRKERYFAFTPKVRGQYVLTVRPDGLSVSSSGRAHVSVFVGDRRILSRVFAALPF